SGTSRAPAGTSAGWRPSGPGRSSASGWLAGAPQRRHPLLAHLRRPPVLVLGPDVGQLRRHLRAEQVVVLGVDLLRQVAVVHACDELADAQVGGEGADPLLDALRRPGDDVAELVVLPERQLALVRLRAFLRGDAPLPAEHGAQRLLGDVAGRAGELQRDRVL